MVNYLKEYFKDWNTWDWCWVITASILGAWLGVHFGEGGWQTVLSIVTCLTGLWCVILVAKGRIFNYYIGIINIIGYGYISYQYQLYGETMLNILYYLPMSVIGIVIWMKHKNPLIKDGVAVKALTNKQRLIVSILCAGIILIYGWILWFMGDPLPLLDSTSTVLSIVAMLLMVARYMEQWLLWIVVNIASIAMWYLTIDANGARDVAILVMWIAYFINSIYGMYSWNKLNNEQPDYLRS